jgi:transcription elongation factor GreB
LNVVRERPTGNAVYFGATVQVCDDAGKKYQYRIVGPDETDTKTAAISIDSPVSRALLGKRVDDTVTVITADKTSTLTILSIHYE